MCPGMRPATGWMANFTSTPCLVRTSNSSRTLCWAWATAMPVPGDDDHRGRVRAAARPPLRARCERTVRPSSPAVPSVWSCPNAAEQHVAERAVHRPAHDERQEEARRAVQSAGDDQDVVAEHEPHGRPGQPGVGVQQRDHRRHVRPADRDDSSTPNDQRERDHEREQHRLPPGRRRAGRDQHQGHAPGARG